jgi:hypothetical protein
VFIPTSVNEERTKRKVLSYGLPREIPHEDYVDGNVIYSDGSFGRMYRLSPVFIDSLDELEQENYASAVAAAVAVQGCDIQFVWRKKADLPLLDGNRDLSDPVLYLMAEDRKKMFLEMAQKEELFSVSAEMWIRKKYPRAVPGSLSAFVEMNEEKAMQRYLQEHNALSADFSILCDSVVSPLERYLKPRVASPEEVVSSLWDYFVGNRDFPEWKCEKPIRSLFAGTDVARRWGYMAVGNRNERLISVLSLDDIPSYSFVSMINHLLFIPMEMTVVANVRALPTDRVKDDLRKLYRRYTSGIIANDPEMQERAAEVDVLLRELETTSGQMASIELYVVLSDKTVQGLSKKISVVTSAAKSRADMTLRQEKAALHLAWRAAMPGWCYVGTTDRDFKIMTKNAADLAPLLGPPASSENPLFFVKAPYATLCGIDIFDPRLPAGHGLTVGSTGSGKSFTMSLLLLSAMAKRPLVFIIDKGGSYRKLCNLLGGSYIDLSGDVAFNPLEGRSSWKERVGIISLMLQTMIGEDGVGREEKVIIERLVTEVYQSFDREGIDREPTLSDAYRILRSQRLYDPDTEDLERAQRQVLLHLAKWTRVGSKGSSFYSKMLDNPSTTVSVEDSDFIVFDLQGVEQYPDVMQVIFLYLTDIVQRRIVNERSRQKILVFDEAWALLAGEDSANFMAELYRTMRKFNCAVWAITQDISDIENSPVAGAIMTNTYRYIVLRQINERAVQAIERILNLNETEKQVVSLLDQKKGYYSEIFLKQMGIGASKAVIIPSPMEYWMATTDPNDNREMTEMLKKYRLEEALKELAREYPHGVSQRKGIA